MNYLTVQAFGEEIDLDVALNSALSHKALAIMKEKNVTPGEGQSKRTVITISRRTGEQRQHVSMQKALTYPRSVLEDAYITLLTEREEAIAEEMRRAEKARMKWEKARNALREKGVEVAEATPWQAAQPALDPQAPQCEAVAEAL